MKIHQWNQTAVLDKNYQLTYMRCDGDYRYPLHRHEGQWEIVYVSAGSFRHTIEGATILQEAGTVQLVRAEDAHELKGRDFSFFNLEVPCQLLDQIEGLGLGFSALRRATRIQPLILSLEERTGLEAHLQKLLFAHQPLVMLTILSQVLVSCLAHLQVTKENHIRLGLVPLEDGASSMPAWMSRAISLAGSAADIPNLDTLVSWCGVAPSHLSRSFRRYLDCTPSTFLTNLRLERASRLLMQTNYSVGTIIERVGFDSPNYFYKLFQTRYGTSPLSYRVRFGSNTHLAD